MFGGFGTDFDDDAILGLHMRQMNEMNSIVNSMFRGGGGGGGMMMGNDFGLPGMFNPFIGHHAQHQQALTGAHQQQQQQQQQQHQQHHHHQHQHHHHAQMLNALMPLGGMGGPFSGMAMPNMNRILMNGGNIPEGVTSFSSSQMVSMTQGPDGRPQVYQATSSTKSGPGGLRETKKTVEDSRTGVKKMAIGHHIGERSHVIEREKNFRSGHEEERQDFVNLEEEEVEDFDKEFQQRSRNYMRPTSNNNGHLQAITAGPISPKISAVQPTTTPIANVTATSSSQHQQQPPPQQNTSPNNSSSVTTTTTTTSSTTTDLSTSSSSSSSSSSTSYNSNGSTTITTSDNLNNNNNNINININNNNNNNNNNNVIDITSNNNNIVNVLNHRRGNRTKNNNNNNNNKNNSTTSMMMVSGRRAIRPTVSSPLTLNFATTLSSTQMAPTTAPSSIHLHPYNQTQRRMYRPMKPRHQHQHQQQQQPQHQQHQQHQNQQQSQQPRQNNININNNNNIQQQ